MDKRRSSAVSEGSSRDPRRQKQQLLKPKTIADNGLVEEFQDASRDPRLAHDKYRSHIMSNSSTKTTRISPDTTMAAAKKMKADSKHSGGNSEAAANLSHCQFCPNSGPLSSKHLEDHVNSHHRNVRFSCGLCQGNTDENLSKFDAIDGVRQHVELVHSINAKEIVDKLIKLPSINFLRSYRCVACPASTGPYIGVTEEKLKAHFKLKHKTNTIKPFLLKRICRICEFDSATNETDLIKHIEGSHPRSQFWSDDDDDDQDDNGADLLLKEEEELNYEPNDDDRSPSPQREPELAIEDGEIVNSDEKARLSSKKRKPPPRSRSSSSSSRSSSGGRRGRKKAAAPPPIPKQYQQQDSSSSSEDDDSEAEKRRRKKAALDKKVKPRSRRSSSDRSPPPEPAMETKRRVYMTTDKKSDAKQQPPPPPRKEDSYFGVTYIPPAGYCEECGVRYDSGNDAQDHFKSRRHGYNVKDRYRCYFCNSYVQDTKGHLESRHRDMTFQCLLGGCNKPRFTQANKVIDHVRCTHPSEYKKTRSDDDMLKNRLISTPKSLASYVCRECNVTFHGDIKIAIVHLVLEHGQNIPEKHHFKFVCRLCGTKSQFDDEKDLDRHCQTHYDFAFGHRGRLSPASRSRSKSVSASPDHRGRNRGRATRRSSSSRSPSSDHDRSSRAGARDQKRRDHSPDSRRGQDNTSGGLKYGKNTLSCHYCKDQFRTLGVRKNHMLREHQNLLFNCGLCTFINMYRRDLLWHLREHHRKDGYTDEALLRDFIRWPKDLRKIICTKCTEPEAFENALWLCVDPNEIIKELNAHADSRHGLTGKDVEKIFSLQCSGCTEKFDMDGEIKYWDEHVETMACKERGARSRSRSRSRSRTPPPPRKARTTSSSTAAAATTSIDVSKQCNYCCKQLDSQSEMDEHVRQRHLDVAFVCRLCDVGEHHYDPDLPSMKKHLRTEHNKDDLENEDLMDYVRYPKNLACIRCNMCGLQCHAQKVEDLELHFKIAHEESDFNTGHLDFLCRLCMEAGQNDSMNELKDHVYDRHPEEAK